MTRVDLRALGPCEQFATYEDIRNPKRRRTLPIPAGVVPAETVTKAGTVWRLSTVTRTDYLDLTPAPRRKD